MAIWLLSSDLLQASKSVDGLRDHWDERLDFSMASQIHKKMRVYSRNTLADVDVCQHKRVR